MTYPPYTAAEARSRETFLALMWALSYPGRVQTLPPAELAFTLIAEALLDLETSYSTPDAGFAASLVRTGAKFLPVDQAAYQFYPSLGEAEIRELREASIGTALYPDTAATLIIACTLDSGPIHTLQGPGIPGSQRVQIGGIAEGFWALRESACRFPLGWDVYFVDGTQIVGLPRTTQVQRV